MVGLWYFPSTIPLHLIPLMNVSQKKSEMGISYSVHSYYRRGLSLPLSQSLSDPPFRSLPNHHLDPGPLCSPSTPHSTLYPVSFSLPSTGRNWTRMSGLTKYGYSGKVTRRGRETSVCVSISLPLLTLLFLRVVSVQSASTRARDLLPRSVVFSVHRQTHHYRVPLVAPCLQSRSR